MPLNPNGKIDKPALPFPDTAQLIEQRSQRTTNKASTTEETMRSIWLKILPNPPTPIPTDESFFDMGGHSVLATRLVFEIRTTFVVDAPLGLIFERPTIAGLAAAVEKIRDADLGLPFKEDDNSAKVPNQNEHDAGNLATKTVKYNADYTSLLPRLRNSYPDLPPDFAHKQLTVFLTGATGFLGAFVLRDLLQHSEKVKKVICLVRAHDASSALIRLRESSTNRGVWDERWVKDKRIEVVIGDIRQDLLGLGTEVFDRIAHEADVVLHNGAFVSSFPLLVDS
jgi:L-aminoadipate-semialdehyde dehydrogenase